MTPATMDTIRTQWSARLAAFTRDNAEPGELRSSAVAIAIVAGVDDEPCFLLTRRARGLRAHAYQYALPGGRSEPGESSADAARRELAEEVGVHLAASAFMGLLDDYVTRSGYVITPAVFWAASDHVEVSADPGEVAEVFTIPVAELDQPPTLSTIAESPSPVIRLPLLGSFIHAPTGAILHQFSEVVQHGRNTRVAHFEQPVFAWR